MLRNALLAVVVLAACVFAAEGALRVLGIKPRIIVINQYFVPNSDTTWSVPDPELGWINKAGTSRSVEAGHETMTFWDAGRRASRPDPALPGDDKIPVMIVGGSDAQSYGVRDEESFPYLLAKRYPNLWIENFGTGGYGTVQSLLMTKRAYTTFYTTRRPRLILLTLSTAYEPRDVADYSWISAISDPEGHYVAPPHFRLEDGKLRFHPFQVLDFWPGETTSSLLTISHEAWLRSVAYRTADQGPVVMRHELTEFATFAANHGAVLAVVMLMHSDAKLQSLLVGLPIARKDCSGFERINPEEYLLGGNGHPNAKLHMLFADCVADWFDAGLLHRVMTTTAPAP